MSNFLNPINSDVWCPNCKQKGSVRSRFVSRKVGISGPKVFLALITFGISLLLLGVSRNETRQKFKCENCLSEWTS